MPTRSLSPWISTLIHESLLDLWIRIVHLQDATQARFACYPKLNMSNLFDQQIERRVLRGLLRRSWAVIIRHERSKIPLSHILRMDVDRSMLLTMDIYLPPSSLIILGLLTFLATKYETRTAVPTKSSVGARVLWCGQQTITAFQSNTENHQS